MQNNPGSVPFDFYDSLFNNSHINAVITMATKGDILSVNPAFTQAFGYTQQELVQKNFSLLFTPADIRRGMPENELKETLTSGQSDDKNFLVKKDGDKVWVSGETILATNEAGEQCLLKVLQDISEQKQSEMVIRRTNEFNESILTSIDDIVVVLNNKLGIVKTNPAFFQLFDPAAAAGNLVSCIAAYDTNGELEKHLLLVAEKNETFSDIPFLYANSGKERIFSVSGRRMPLAYNGAGVLVLMHDITYQKQSEREKEDIIGFVAHELRNPLSNVMLCNEMLKHYIATNQLSQAGEMLQRSQNNVFRLNKMISELYEATKISSGNISVELTAFHFDAMIKEAIDTVQVLQPAFNIVVHGHAGTAIGDRYRLIQVVTNYLSNGIKYSNGHTNVHLYISKQNGMLTVAVKDEGLGIAPAQLPHIFERFYRAEKTKNLEGIGLGLYLCSRIIEAHHGRVWAESTEGQGSIFYFSIPSN